MNDLLSLIHLFFNMSFKYTLIISYSFDRIDINENEEIVSYVSFII